MMTISLASPPDGARQRQSRVVAACLRAAYAWSERESRPGAMREIARMTGVVMEALGPGRGPASPMALIGCLRRPLGELVTLAGEEPGSADDAITEAVLLDSDRLADAAYDMACEYAQQLTTAAETAAWLPSWTRMRAEQVENEAFSALVESGDKDAYTRARRLIVEYPAGDAGGTVRADRRGQGTVPRQVLGPVRRPAVHGPGRQLVVALPGLPVADDRHGRGRALPVPAPPGRLPGHPGTSRDTAAAAAHRRPRPGHAPRARPGRRRRLRRPRRVALSSSSPAPRNSGSPRTWRSSAPTSGCGRRWTPTTCTSARARWSAAWTSRSTAQRAGSSRTSAAGSRAQRSCSRNPTSTRPTSSPRRCRPSRSSPRPCCAARSGKPPSGGSNDLARHAVPPGAPERHPVGGGHGRRVLPRGGNSRRRQAGDPRDGLLRARRAPRSLVRVAPAARRAPAPVRAGCCGTGTTRSPTPRSPGRCWTACSWPGTCPAARRPATTPRPAPSSWPPACRWSTSPTHAWTSSRRSTARRTAACP